VLLACAGVAYSQRSGPGPRGLAAATTVSALQQAFGTTFPTRPVSVPTALRRSPIVRRAGVDEETAVAISTTPSAGGTIYVTASTNGRKVCLLGALFVSCVPTATLVDVGLAIDVSWRTEARGVRVLITGVSRAASEPISVRWLGGGVSVFGSHDHVLSLFGRRLPVAIRWRGPSREEEATFRYQRGAGAKA